MKKEEFLKQLEYLLQDVPDEDKEEAIAYYRDYLEEAGSENEEKAIEEFGSPERVAAIIRADAAGNLKDGGSFTEKGYEDERFRDPNYQVAKRLDLPDEKESEGSHGYGGHADGTHTYAGEYEGRPPFRERYTRSRTTDTVYEQPKKKPWTSQPLKLVLLAILLVVASPFLLGAGGIAVGAVATVLCLVGGVIITVLVLTAAAFIISVCLGALGLAFLISAPLDSLFLFGIAIAGIGCGLIGLVLLFLILKLFPLCWRGIKSLGTMIFKGRGAGKA